MNGSAGERPDLRVSDADRDAIMGELGEHFQAGRLDSEEFGQRLEAAASARTRGDLDRLMADLPRAAPGQPPVPRARHGVPVAVIVAMAVAAALALLAISGEFAEHGSAHGHWGWGVTWWVIVIPVLLLRRLLWRGNSSRGPR
jgi:Domain of unknown function (DUF1707)